MPANLDSNELKAVVRALASEIRDRHRSHLRELRIEVVEGGIILHGRAVSFYGKQIAFHEVRTRCELVVVANQIEVQERLTEDSLRVVSFVLRTSWASANPS